MGKQRNDGQETRRNLLAAAGENQSLFDDVKQLADHVIRFSMAGILALGNLYAQQSDNEVRL